MCLDFGSKGIIKPGFPPSPLPSFLLNAFSDSLWAQNGYIFPTLNWVQNNCLFEVEFNKEFILIGPSLNKCQILNQRPKACRVLIGLLWITHPSWGEYHPNYREWRVHRYFKSWSYTHTHTHTIHVLHVNFVYANTMLY